MNRPPRDPDGRQSGEESDKLQKGTPSKPHISGHETPPDGEGAPRASQTAPAPLQQYELVRKVADHPYGVQILGGTAAAVVSAALIGGFTVLLGLHRDDGSNDVVPTPPATESISSSPPAPAESPAESVSASRTFDYGQMAGGDIVRAAVNDSDFTNNPSARAGDTITFKMRLSNGGPQTLTGVRVTAIEQSGTSDPYVSFEMRATADNAYLDGSGDNGEADEATVDIPDGSCALHLPDTTTAERLDGSGRHRLADGIFEREVALPDIDASLSDVLMVSFQMRVLPPSECE